MTTLGRSRRLGLLAALVAVVWGLVCLARPDPAPAQDDCYYQLPVGVELSALYDCLKRQKELYNQSAGLNIGARYLFRIGKLYTRLYQLNSKPTYLDEALDAYRRLINHYPNGRLADDAQYNIGRIYLDQLRDEVKAYIEFLKVELNYPQGDMVAPAQAELKRLGREIRIQVEADRTVPPKVSGPASPPAPTTTMSPTRPEPDDRIARVTGLRHWSTESYTRVVVDLSGPFRFTSRLLDPDPGLGKPARLYVDLSDARLTGLVPKKVDLAGKYLRAVRVGRNDDSTVRVVLDVNTIDSYKLFALSSPDRLVIDVTGPKQVVAAGPAASSQPAAPAGEAAASQPTAPAGETTPSRPASVTAPAGSPEPPDRIENEPLPAEPDQRAVLSSPEHKSASKRFAAGYISPTVIPRGRASHQADSALARQLGLGVNTVVIDPGHGGRDPGARTCKTGLWEKEITLAVAKRLAVKLRQRMGVKVHLTRTTDKTVPLEERTAMANTLKADLFISIHVNASENAGLAGVETYFLNLASDDRAIEVAARENATTTKSISDLEAILNELMLNTKINESNRLAFNVQKRLVHSLRRHYRSVRSLGVKQAPFYVLLGASMPAVLVEIGFGSNRIECRRLGAPGYYNRVAEGIAAGVIGYVQANKIDSTASTGTGSEMKESSKGKPIGELSEWANRKINGKKETRSSESAS